MEEERCLQKLSIKSNIVQVGYFDLHFFRDKSNLFTASKPMMLPVEAGPSPIILILELFKSHLFHFLSFPKKVMGIRARLGSCFSKAPDIPDMLRSSAIVLRVLSFVYLSVIIIK